MDMKTGTVISHWITRYSVIPSKKLTFNKLVTVLLFHLSLYRCRYNVSCHSKREPTVMYWQCCQFLELSSALAKYLIPCGTKNIQILGLCWIDSIDHCSFSLRIESPISYIDPKMQKKPHGKKSGFFLFYRKPAKLVFSPKIGLQVHV